MVGGTYHSNQDIGPQEVLTAVTVIGGLVALILKPMSKLALLLFVNLYLAYAFVVMVAIEIAVNGLHLRMF